jgi:transcriptional regulator with XRE-family HTH domain
MSIYERVKLLCSERGISLRKLSRDCGFSAATITKWKDHAPSADKIQKVADYFGVSTDWLNGLSAVRNFEQDVYYTNPDIAEKVQRLSDKQRAVMKAVPDLQPGEVDLLWVMIEQFRNGNE